MLIYILNVVFIIIWALAFLTTAPRRWKKISFISLSFTQMFLISIFRYHIGNDYQMYADGFFRMGIKGFSTLEHLDWEYGFNIYTKVIAYFTNDPKIFFAITAFICLVPAAIFIYRNSRMLWLSVLLYVNLSFFYCTMNYLRQSMAIAFALIAWEFMKKRKFLPFLLIILFAATFHNTVLIMIPIYFIVALKPKIQVLLLYCYGLLWFYISSEGFINILTDFFHSEYKNSIFIKEGLSFVYSLIPLIILAFAYIYKDKLMEMNITNKIYINLIYLSAFLMIIMSKHAILERFSYYSYIYVIVFVPELVYCVKNVFDAKLNRKSIATALHQKQKFDEIKAKSHIFYGSHKGIQIACIIIVVIVVSTTAYNILGMLVGESGIHGVYPYQTWL